MIGAGGAGLSAAGGNTIRAGGGFNAAIKADYEKAGIKARTPQAKSYLEPEVCHWSND